jgi:hypothetical protein
MDIKLNLLFAWVWILLCFITGMVMGMFFHGENWLGGYGSFQRRMYRLGHISFFGLGVVNLCFFLTMKSLAATSEYAGAASWCFIIGGVTMPLSCLIMAHFPKAHAMFALPVLSLIAGAVFTLMEVAKT